jgi:hypothetical protein
MKRRGASLVELVVAVGIAGVIAIGLNGALFVSVRTLPNAQSPAQTALSAGQLVDQIATELESAIYVFERTATSIGFTVPDRNQDGKVERIRYGWSGTPAGPLTRKYNGGTAVTLAGAVDVFSLTPTYKNVAESYPSVCVEDASESLLIDKSSITGAANQNVSLTNWFGQYFTMALPAGAYAWRPTRVDCMAHQVLPLTSTAVEMRRAASTSTPDTKLLDQANDITDANLGGSYNWTISRFNNLPPLPSNAAICYVLRYKSSLLGASMTVESSSAGTGLLKTFTSGLLWTNDGGNSLVSRMYGKLLRSSGTQSVNSNYLTAMAVDLRLTGGTRTVKGTAPLLNHPEMLSGKWELKFDQDPTTVDVNGDGAADWSVNGGSAFNLTTLSNGVWRTTTTQLNTAPNCDFNKATVVDLKFQNVSVGGNGATFAINALRSGSTCAPIGALLTLESDGTQTLQVYGKMNDSTRKALILIGGLPAQPVLLHLVIDPATTSVSITVNNVQQGTYAVTRYSSSDSNRYASIGTDGGTSEFSYARIRVAE